MRWRGPGIVITGFILQWSCLPLWGAPQSSVLAAVDFQQRIGQPLAAAEAWADRHGGSVSLTALQKGRPMILVLSWFDCDSLCPMLLKNLAGALAKQSLDTAGYAVVAVSIDPGEGPAAAREFRHELQRGSGSSLDNWHFLTGSKSNISLLSGSVGFRYSYDEKRDRYAHPAGVVIVSPDGTINRYLLGLTPKSRDLRLALVAADAGRLGNPVDQLLLRCYHFDPQNGRYNLAVMRVIQILGVLFLIGLVIYVVIAQRRSAQ